MNVVSLLTPKIQVVFLYDDYTIQKSLMILREHGFTAVPVLSRDGQYVGTVSEGDFLWHFLDRPDDLIRLQERKQLKEVLRPDFNPPVSVRVGMEALLERAMGQNFVPVVDDRGAFMGIVTRRTVIRKLTVPSAACARAEAAAILG